MKRRTLLTVGITGGVLLTLVGGTLALLQPGRKAGQLTPSGRQLFTSLAQAVLGPMLPQEPQALAQALQAHLARVELTIAGMPPHVQAEVDELITIAGSAPGRLALVGLTADWATATVPQVSAALQSMRLSSVSLRQQAYQGLRELTNAAYFADNSTWSAMGYPGQRVLNTGPTA
ncbi:MAG: hypothetical protein Q8M96_02500 [Rubrivivax sp.]|nr:hypothetical protein [Rubrivivax sp.]